MLQMWFAKDGPRPDSQSGPSIQLTNVEAMAMFENCECLFVGVEAPSINKEKPSNSLKNVVIEVEVSSDVCALFPAVGYYVIVGLLPSQVQYSLDEFRGNN